MRRRALLTGLGACTLGLAGCLNTSKNQASAPPREPPEFETQIVWAPDWESYEIDLMKGWFTDNNTGWLAVEVTFPDDDPYRKVWAGGEKADRFPVEAGDELVVGPDQRGTVKLLWRPPGGNDTTVLETHPWSEQPNSIEQ